MRFVRLICLAALISSPVWPQAVPIPWINVQFTDQAGNALAGGRVYTCTAGTACPGTPLATYTTSSASVANTNPIILDSSGRAAIWLTADTAYKFVVTNALGAIVAGAGGDNIIGGSGGSGGGGGGGSSQWTTSGSNIYYSTGSVFVGSTSGSDKFEVLGVSRFRGAVRIANTDATPRYVELVTPAGMASSYSLQFSPTLSDGCMYNTAGVLSFTSCAGGGGSGADNYQQSFTAQTTVVLAHNLNSTKLLIQCYTSAGVQIEDADITSITRTDANNATVVFAGSTTGDCSVNRSAGNPNLWALTGTDVNLTSSSYNLELDATMKVSTDNSFDIGTASGASRTAPRNIYTSTMVESPMFRTSYVSGGSVADYFDWKTYGGTGAVGLFDSSATGVFVYVASGPVFYAKGEFSPETTNTYGLGSSSFRWNTLFVKDVNISGTCSGCGGGGGLPVSDAISIVTGSTDATKQLRFEVDGFTTATIRVLTPQDSSYILAGTNIAQTFTQNQTFSAHHLFGANNTYDVGTVASQAGSIYAYTTMQSQKMRVAYMGGGTSIVDYFDFTTDGSSGLLRLKDSSSNVLMQYVPSVFVWRGEMSPNGVYNIGAAGNRWATGYFTNINISGTCTGCGSGVTSVGTTTPIAGGPITSTGTISCPTCLTTDTNQTITGTKTWSSSIVFSSNNAYNVGSSTVQPNTVYGYTAVISQKLRVGYYTGTTLNDYFDFTMDGSTGLLRLRDSASNILIQYSNAGTPNFVWRGLMAPNASATYDIGTTTLRWKDGYFSGNVTSSGGYINGTEVRVAGNVVINSSGILSNAFGVSVAAGIAGTAFNIYGGATGHTGSTCSAWTGGICTAP